jgi:hypothetical protein
MATRQTGDPDRRARIDSHKSGLTESQNAYRAAQHSDAPDPTTSGGTPPMKNTQQEDRAATNRSHPPSGRNDDDTHALRAGDKEPTQRKSTHEREPSTRDAGSDDRRSGSESGKD